MEQSSFRPLYDPTAVQPMRDELVRVGIQELRSPEDVDRLLAKALAEGGTALLVVNSVCGCAAGNARPGAMLALQNAVIPDHLFTVFAGQDRAATESARRHIRGYPPSSPCIVLFRNGEVDTILERHQIEGRSPQDIARTLTAAFDRACTRKGPSVSREELERIAPQRVCGSSVAPYRG